MRLDFSVPAIVMYMKKLLGECVAFPYAKVYKNNLEMHVSVVMHLKYHRLNALGSSAGLNALVFLQSLLALVSAQEISKSACSGSPRC